MHAKDERGRRDFPSRIDWIRGVQPVAKQAQTDGRRPARRISDDLSDRFSSGRRSSADVRSSIPNDDEPAARRISARTTLRVARLTDNRYDDDSLGDRRIMQIYPSLSLLRFFFSSISSLLQPQE